MERTLLKQPKNSHTWADSCASPNTKGLLMTDEEWIKYILADEKLLAQAIEILKNQDTKDMNPETKASHERFLKSQMLVEAFGLDKNHQEG